MKLRIIAIMVMAALNSLALAEDGVDPKPPQMNIAEVYDLVVSLMEFREKTQHKRFDEGELKVISGALSTARFLKKMEHEDIARTPYISRYHFTHGFLGGTLRTGETESGMLTINCRTLYWKDWIFTLDEASAEKLKKLFPKPKNPLTESELPAVRTEEKQAEQQRGAGQPATRSESNSQGGDKPQPEAEERTR